MTVKTALVTGAARGIGLAVAKRFLAEGWNVALLDINAAQLRETMAALAEPSKTFEIICDVSDPSAIAAAVRQAAAHFGRLDALVNNAGIAIFKPILETTPEDWARVLAVNLTGPFLAAQAAAPIMAEAGGGAMVNITSISGLRASTLEIRADYHDHLPLNRYGLEAELAEAVFFLCSDRASYLTGQVIAVDGGFDATGIGLPTLRAERRNL
jgi:NAD(P)-dependent dehydrogenase (short-subunit alcohol dehydrogenase family)